MSIRLIRAAQLRSHSQPHGKTFKYAGRVVQLTSEQEEVATMFAAMISTDYAKKPTFRNVGAQPAAHNGNVLELLDVERCSTCVAHSLFVPATG